MLGPTRRAHFIGVGGSGMSPLAEILLRGGIHVSGSDVKASDVTEHLQALGLDFREGHDAAHVGDVDVVVRSSAVRLANPEVVEAGRRGIPVILRGELLAELMRGKSGVAIAGAHGKTTTTSMVGLVLDRAGLDPTVVIGGRLAQFGSSARVGSGEVLVAEADESDRSFLMLAPVHAVVTNIDHEHLESYAGFEDLVQAFASFIARVPFYGAAVCCTDDEVLRRLAASTPRRLVRYGLDDPNADLTATDVVLEGFGLRASIVRRTRAGRETLGTLTLQVPGRHNLLNALAAIGIGLELHVPFAAIAAALAEFRGAERRFERKGDARGVTVVDDYGHHPTEITAVLRAARGTGARRIVCVFQPHRYTRTAQLLHEFGPALALADEIVLTDIYPAGEDPLPGVTIERLAEEVQRAHGGRVHVVKALADVPAAVARIATPGDLVLTMGAGSWSDRWDRGSWRRSRRGRSGAGRQTVSALAHPAVPPAVAVADAPACGGAHVDRRRGARGRRLVRGTGGDRFAGAARQPDSRAWQSAPVPRRCADVADRPRRRASPADRPRAMAAKGTGSPWVEQAVLRRVLPSTVEVVIRERTPMAIGRIRGDLYLVDEEGLVIDEFGPNYAQFDLPIVDGLADAAGGRGTKRRPRTSRAGRGAAPGRSKDSRR